MEVGQAAEVGAGALQRVFGAAAAFDDEQRDVGTEAAELQGDAGEDVDAFAGLRVDERDEAARRVRLAADAVPVDGGESQCSRGRAFVIVVAAEL